MLVLCQDLVSELNLQATENVLRVIRKKVRQTIIHRQKVHRYLSTRNKLSFNSKVIEGTRMRLAAMRAQRSGLDLVMKRHLE